MIQSVTKVGNIKIKSDRVSVPKELRGGNVALFSAESDNLLDFISSQHPLINVWLVFSLCSIGILSLLLFII